MDSGPSEFSHKPPSGSFDGGEGSGGHGTRMDGRRSQVGGLVT